MKIYLIEGSSGSYSDYRQWVVNVAYKNLVDAQYMKALLEDRIPTAPFCSKKWYAQVDELERYDKDVLVDDDLEYKIVEMELK